MEESTWIKLPCKCIRQGCWCELAAHNHRLNSMLSSSQGRGFRHSGIVRTNDWPHAPAHRLLSLPFEFYNNCSFFVITFFVIKICFKNYIRIRKLSTTTYGNIISNFIFPIDIYQNILMNILTIKNRPIKLILIPIPTWLNIYKNKNSAWNHSTQML